MKIVAINGSSKGRNGNTHVMVDAFLKGAQETGADTVNVFLAEKEIAHCKGCHICWTKGPGQCVTKDDMLGVLSILDGANVIIFASPVYFENISGMLKVFMDRITMIGSPHSQERSKTETKPPEPKKEPVNAPMLMMISSCGYPDSSQFQVISLWINRVAQKMHMELIGEIYAGQGKCLTTPPEELRPVIAAYLKVVEKAGREIAADMKLS